ncbi:MAG TPA: DUF1178 family protein [Polaromonas sp.]|uniref:DUF1178 family protein n=1 Tax=Polaromonas sp. TaxID=1869339 RepID=UPI002D673866|nr:DUF1178 family protein [Polaromonas sp.]HYW57535.1 DUF1178 family protein [Polaromonas sp.]
MKVLDLQCSYRHSFEGWFGSEEDFQSQLTRGLVACPMCADLAIQKMPSAPRLNFGAPVSAPSASREVAVTDATPHQMVAPASAAGQSEFLEALRHVLANTEDVGERFANEARAMHYGDAEHRNIRGQASLQDAVELIEEGIEVMPLPLPAAVKETLQ